MTGIAGRANQINKPKRRWGASRHCHRSECARPRAQRRSLWCRPGKRGHRGVIGDRCARGRAHAGEGARATGLWIFKRPSPLRLHAARWGQRRPAKHLLIGNYFWQSLYCPCGSTGTPFEQSRRNSIRVSLGALPSQDLEKSLRGLRKCFQGLEKCLPDFREGFHGEPKSLQGFGKSFHVLQKCLHVSRDRFHVFQNLCRDGRNVFTVYGNVCRIAGKVFSVRGNVGTIRPNLCRDRVKPFTLFSPLARYGVRREAQRHGAFTRAGFSKAVSRYACHRSPKCLRTAIS